VAWLTRSSTLPSTLPSTFARLAFVVATGARVELTTGERRSSTAARLGTLTAPTITLEVRRSEEPT